MEVQRPPNFEDLLDTVGHFGFYQFRIYIILTLMDISNSQLMLFYVFGNIVPDWTCSKYSGISLNNSEPLNYTENGGNFTNASEFFRGRCKYLGAKCESFQYGGRIKSIVSEWDLVCDKSYVAPLTSTILFAGVLVGAFLSGQIADMFGRKRLIIVMATMQMLCQIVLGFTNPWQVYAVVRFVTGIFIGGSLTLCFTIPMEFIGPKWRTLVGGLGLFGIGLCLLCLWAWILPDWRHQAFASGASCVLLVPCIILWVPESIRWLIQKGRFEEAEEILIQMAAVNKKPVPKLCILREIAQIDNAENEAVARYSYLDLFRTKDNAIKTVINMMVWLSCSTLYYGIGGQLVALFGNMYINTMIGALTSMPLSWTVIPVANWIGRKKAYLIYVLFPCCGLIVILIMAGTGGHEQYPIVVTAFALVCLSGVNAAWMIGTLYSGELYATLIRNMAIGICSCAARVGGILAPQFGFLGVIVHWTVPYVIYAFLSIGSTIAVLIYLPETNKLPLPETVFTKDNKYVPASQVVLTDAENGGGRIANGHIESCGEHIGNGYAETEKI